jgi:hypothetical protein
MCLITTLRWHSTHRNVCVLSDSRVCENGPTHVDLESLSKQDNSFHSWTSQLTELDLLLLDIVLFLRNSLGPMDDPSLRSVQNSILHCNSNFLTILLRSSKIITSLSSNMLPLLPLPLHLLLSDFPILNQFRRGILVLPDLLELLHVVVYHEIDQDLVVDAWIGEAEGG